MPPRSIGCPTTTYVHKRSPYACMLPPCAKRRALPQPVARCPGREETSPGLEALIVPMAPSCAMASKSRLALPHHVQIRWPPSLHAETCWCSRNVSASRHLRPVKLSVSASRRLRPMADSDVYHSHSPSATRHMHADSTPVVTPHACTLHTVITSLLPTHSPSPQRLLTATSAGGDSRPPAQVTESCGESCGGRVTSLDRHAILTSHSGGERCLTSRDGGTTRSHYMTVAPRAHIT